MGGGREEATGVALRAPRQVPRRLGHMGGGRGERERRRKGIGVGLAGSVRHVWRVGGAGCKECGEGGGWR